MNWRRDDEGTVSFYDSDGQCWTPWRAGGGCPPLPPGWSLLGVPTRFARSGIRSPWRVLPIVLVVAAVIYAVVQVEHPGGNPVAKEAATSAALLGKCLSQDGTSAGHPKYSATPVDCTAANASVKVVEVVPTNPGSTGCPASTTPFLILYSGVTYPHELCLAPVTK